MAQIKFNSKEWMPVYVLFQDARHSLDFLIASKSRHQRDFEFHGRQFFRASFALIEGATFVVKNVMARRCAASKIKLTAAELDFVHERDYKLETGIVKEQKAMIRTI